MASTAIDVGDLYEIVAREIFYLRRGMAWYLSLFVHDEQRFEAVMRFDSQFFGFVQLVVKRDLILSICRLLDPAVQGRNRNATIFALLDMLPQSSRSEFDTEERALERFRAKFSDIRNKLLAHRDFDRAPEIKVNKEFIFRPIDLKRAVDLLSDVIDRVAGPLKVSQITMIDAYGGPDPAESMLKKMNCMTAG